MPLSELLLHPLRVVGDELPAILGEGEEVEQLVGAAAAELAIEAVHAPGEEQVFLTGETLVERQLFGEDSDHTLEREQIAGKREAFDRGIAGGGSQQAREHLDGRALARAVRAQEPEEGTARDGQIEGVDRDLATKRLREAADFDGGRGLAHDARAARPPPDARGEACGRERAR
jgi:hypothetical protein